MAFALTWLPQVLRSAGLEVVEQPGWRTRGHGDMEKVLGILCHHTASHSGTKIATTIRLITEGRPNLKGPLSHLALDRKGTYYVIAAGRGYHAGPGNWHGVTKGNSHFIGIEAENDGVGEIWPEEQMVAYAQGCAAIAVFCGFKVHMVAGHKEYAIPPGRKIDPSFDMDLFRVRVGDYMAAMK